MLSELLELDLLLSSVTFASRVDRLNEFLEGDGDFSDVSDFSGVTAGSGEGDGEYLSGVIGVRGGMSGLSGETMGRRECMEGKELAVLWEYVGKGAVEEMLFLLKK